MSIEITTQEELEEWRREREEFWERVVIRKSKQKQAAGQQPPGLDRGGGGSGLTCAYPECEREAKEYCSKCYLPFCEEHVGKHECLGFWLHQYTHDEALKYSLRKNIEELRTKTKLAVTPRFREVFEEESYETVVNKLKGSYPNMVNYLYNLRNRVLLRKMSVMDLVNYVLCKLYFKLLEYSRRHGKTIIMSKEVYEALQSFPQNSSPRIGGLAFQWWISLEILDFIMTLPDYELKGSDYEKKLYRFSVQNGAAEAWIFFDSYTKERLRPDIYAQLWKYRTIQGYPIPLTLFESEKIIEIKLSQSALEKSMDRFERYINTWGIRKIALAVGTPCLIPLNVRKYDSIITMDENELTKTVEDMVKFLLKKND